MGNNSFVVCDLEDLFILHLFSLAYVASTLTSSRPLLEADPGWKKGRLPKYKNNHQLMAGPLSRSLCPSISRNNEEKMTPTTMSIFLNGCGSHFVFYEFIPKAIQIIRNI